MPLLRAIAAAVLLFAGTAGSQVYPVHFPTPDGGLIYGDLYGDRGDHGVVLAHSANSTKDDWGPLPELLAEAGFRVLAIDFRGYGESRGGGWSRSLYGGGLYFDVLAGVRYLRRMGAKEVSVIGARQGGAAAAQATVKANLGEIQNLILLSPHGIRDPQMTKGRKLYLVRGGDNYTEMISRQYERAPDPKKFVLLENAGTDEDSSRHVQEQQLYAEMLLWLAGQ